MHGTRPKNPHDDHNKYPEKILDHTWEIVLSLKGIGQLPPGPHEREFFQPGDRFKIVTNAKFKNPKDLLFIIHSKTDDFIYVLDAKLVNKSPYKNKTNIYEKVEVRFFDTIGAKATNRIITLQAVKFNSKYNSSSKDCKKRLANVGSFIKPGDQQHYCNKPDENILVWKITDSGSTGGVTEGLPEPGQGTASGRSR